jgi:hypothetical protein
MIEKQDPANQRSPKTEADLDDKTKRYHETLRQTGKLVDVDESTDLSRLPSHVTHIRWPDGRIERLQFD